MEGRRELIIRHGDDTYRLQDHRFQQADPHEISTIHPGKPSLSGQTAQPAGPSRTHCQPGVLFLGATGYDNQATSSVYCWRVPRSAGRSLYRLRADTRRHGADAARRHRQHHRRHPPRNGPAHHHALVTPGQPVPTQLDAVTTAATRTRRPLDDVPATVSVITTEDIDRENMQDVRDLVRNEPGVTVGNNPFRAGLPELPDPRHRRQPRAADGRRHAHARLPRLQHGRRHLHARAARPRGHQARRDHPRPRLGALRLRRDRRRGRLHHQGSRRLHDRAARTSTPASRPPTAAPTSSSPRPSPARCEQGNVEFLGIYTRRDGHEFYPAQSSLGAQSRPASYNNDFLAKLVLRPTDVDTIRLTGGYTQGRQSTQILSGVGNFSSLFARIFDEWGQDYTKTYRISAQWVHDAPIGFIDRIDFLAYFNSVYTQADTYQLRGAFNGAIPTNARTSQFYYTQNVAGAELQMNTDTMLFGARNIFTYGLSFAYTTTTRPRDRWQITLATGARTKVVAGETFPNKNFPDTETIQAGVYVQDEITALGGRLTLTAGGAARLLPAQPQSRPLFLELHGRHAERGADRQHLRVGLAQVRRDLPLLGHLFVATSSTRRASARRPTTTPTSASPTPPRSTRSCPTPTSSPRRPTASRSASAASTRTARAGSSPASTTSTTTSWRR